LLLASVFKLAHLLLFKFDGCKLLSSVLAFTFLKCTLGTESINFSLAILSLLLELTEFLNLVLLLGLLALLLVKSLLFLERSFLVVAEYLHVLVALLLSALDLGRKGDFVGFFNLLHHLSSSLLFNFVSLTLLFLHSFNLSLHLSHLFLSHLLLLDAFDFSLLNLINDNKGTFLLGLMLKSLSFLHSLKTLKSFNFHHEVQFLLLIEPV